MPSRDLPTREGSEPRIGQDFRVLSDLGWLGPPSPADASGRDQTSALIRSARASCGANWTR